MLQVQPDWTRSNTAEEAEKYFEGFKFKGPGWYLNDTDSILVVPRTPSDNDWKAQWSPDTVFIFYVYNCPFRKTIFGGTDIPPIKVDDRT